MSALLLQPDRTFGLAIAGRTGPLTGREREFLATSDTFFLASASETGWPYVQRRVGPPGFVRVLDDATVGWAEFAGNHQYVSVGDTDVSERVALICVDFARRQRLKLLGRLRWVDVAQRPDLELLLAIDGDPGCIERFAIVDVEGLDWSGPPRITSGFTGAGLDMTDARSMQ